MAGILRVRNGSAWDTVVGPWTHAAQHAPGGADPIAVENQCYSGGRPTTESGVPVSITDRANQATIYWTPYGEQGNALTVLDGSDNKVHLKFVETAYTVAGTSGKNYDVFGWSNGGTLALERSAAWTDDVTQADTLAYINGMWVKSADHTRRLLFSFRCSGTNVTADVGGSGATPAQRFVASAFNLVRKSIHSCPGYVDGNNDTSYTTTSTTLVEANGGINSRAGFLLAVPGTIEVGVAAFISGGTNLGLVGLGIDSVSNASVICGAVGAATFAASRRYAAGLAAGYHYAALLIVSINGQTQTFYSDVARYGGSVDPYATHISGTVMQ